MEINEFENSVDTETTYLDATPEGMSAFLAGMNGGKNDGVPAPTDPVKPVESDEGQADQPAPEAAPQDTGRDYAIRYKGKDETLHLTEDEVIKELQKARDYADVRKERDELKAASGKTKEYEQIFAHFARENGMEPDEYFAYCKEQTEEPALLDAIKQAHPEISDETAKELLTLQREKREREEAAKAEAANMAAAQAEIDAVRAEYPDFDPDNLPDPVKRNIEGGMKPLDAMRLNDLIELRKKYAEQTNTLNALQKEKENRQKAPGRLNNSGSDEGISPFARGFFGGGL